MAAAQAVRALKVEYEELPFVLDVQKAMEPDAPQIHEDCPGNILAHTDIRRATIRPPSRSRASSGWRAGTTPPRSSTATLKTTAASPMMEAGRVVVVTSTQIPHIVRRVVGQAWGSPGARSGSSSPTSAAALATSRTPCTSLLRLALHPGGGPAGASGVQPGGDLCLQPGPPRHPHPHHLLCPAGRHPGGPEV